MSFLLDDTDQSVMEAALSLVDEFAGDVVGAQDPITVSAPQASQEDCVQALVSKAQMAPREHINERKKMLRAAGVYGNSNHDAREAAWEHFRGSEKHMGNGSVYEKTAEDANAPYTILEDFTKEMHSNSARPK
ncbi:hypothetical protein Pcac1_g10709 [Phytophthora cactorum]|nr:hypothetical protein Pcac1_g10709 [Phytophthora cactorum]